jgi:hypothetical protein
MYLGAIYLVSFGSAAVCDGDVGLEELTLLLLLLLLMATGIISSKIESEKVMCLRAPKRGLQPDLMLNSSSYMTTYLKS